MDSKAGKLRDSEEICGKASVESNVTRIARIVKFVARVKASTLHHNCDKNKNKFFYNYGRYDIPKNRQNINDKIKNH